MPDRQRHSVLEADLRALADELDAQLGDVDLSEQVTHRLRARAEPAPAHQRRWRRRVAVALVTGAVVAVLAVPSARAAVTSFLDIGVVRVHRGAPPGPVSPTADLQLGARTTLDSARAQFPLVAPSARGVGTPDEVWSTPAGGGGVSLVYDPGPDLPAAAHTHVGLLVQEFSGENRATVNKYLSTGARAREVTVGSQRAIFISGGDHFVSYETASGEGVYENGRLAGNALILQRGPLTIRIEGDLPLDRMIAIAQSLR